ncbi:hypothetical protein L6164_005849 [Bauhinia variegata]|uniref:Uncharacterized protein n=1 Tax=Bauhinia variegata TaxID=167791 RepID=A0ACB9PSJ2_BAUVA|nr:hypothetical protein L6164_005849 [Bauhinia variegata]
MGHFIPFCLSSLLLLLLLPSPSSSFIPHDLLLAGSNYPSVQATKFIRELNLFPKEDVNIVHGGNFSLQTKKIVEKRFRFPNLWVLSLEFRLRIWVTMLVITKSSILMPQGCFTSSLNRARVRRILL